MLSDIDVRDQLDRLLHSKSLQGSEVHRRLLTYLAHKSLAGEGESLKEYTIALEALGKPSSYDPKHDSVVRIQIGRLRTKLSEYYQTEGTADPILVNLPKGSFKVNFAPAPPGPPSEALATARWRRIALGLAALAACALLWAVAATMRLAPLERRTAAAEAAWNPDLEQFWAPFLTSNRPLMICLGTPLFASFPDRGFFRAPGANSWEELQKSKEFMALTRETAAVAGSPAMPWFAFTGVGEGGAAFLVGKLLGTRRQDILTTRSNLLSWQQISDTNLIFLGPPKFNPQLQAMPAQGDITMESTGVRIAHPHGGEPAFLEDVFHPGPQFNGTTHALISRMPGLSGHGEVLTLAGNGTPDTLAAAQWVTEPGLSTRLMSHLKMPSGRIPDHFQSVIKVQFKNGVPVDSAYVLHHVLADPH